MIVSDIDMPGLDGFEVSLRLRSLSIDTPVPLGDLAAAIERARAAG